jgi:hypothetical protein
MPPAMAVTLNSNHLAPPLRAPTRKVFGKCISNAHFPLWSDHKRVELAFFGLICSPDAHQIIFRSDQIPDVPGVNQNTAE